MTTESMNVKLTNYLNRFTLWLKHVSFGAKEQRAFLQDISSLIEDGVPATQTLETVGRISKGSAVEVAESMLHEISQGKPLAEGMAGWFPEHIVELIRAGETGGTLVETMHSAAETLGKKTEALAGFFSAITYPSVVIIMGLFVLLYLKGSIFTQFAEIKPISQWPDDGKMLVALATFVANWWWAAIIGFVLLMVGISKMLRDYVGTYRAQVDKLPILSLYRKLTAGRFMETLGLLIANGVSFKFALKIMHHQASPYLAWHLVTMEYLLGKGKGNIADVLDTNLLDDSDLQRLRVIAAAKGFEQALVRFGKLSNLKVLQTIKVASKILGGILLGLGAGLAAFMITSIYSVGSSLASGG